MRIFTFTILILLVSLSAFSAFAHKNKDDPDVVYNPSIHHSRPADFEETPSLPAVSFYSNFRSKYMWRGLPSSKGFVWQPSASVEFLDVGLNIWANFVLNDEANQGEFNEVDFTTYYTFRFKNLTIHPFVLFVLHPNPNPHSLDFSTTSSVEPSLHVSYELGPVDIFGDFAVRAKSAKGSIYADFGVGFSHKLPLNFSVETSALIGIGDSRFNKAHIADVGTKLNLFEYSLSFPWNPWKGLILEPNVHISVILPPSLRSAMNDPTNIWGGLDVTYNF